MGHLGLSWHVHIEFWVWGVTGGYFGLSCPVYVMVGSGELWVVLGLEPSLISGGQGQEEGRCVRVI